MKNLVAIALIYLASWCYIIASYYHLSLENWSFIKALIIAMPFVIIEYSLSLNGNKLANHSLNSVQILLITICFYLVNAWILNVVVLKSPINPLRDAVAFCLIIVAVLVSSNVSL